MLLTAYISYKSHSVDLSNIESTKSNMCGAADNPITSKIMSFLWGLWIYSAALVSSYLRAATLYDCCGHIIVWHSGWWGMTDTKTLWPSISSTEARPFSITNFKPLALAVSIKRNVSSSAITGGLLPLSLPLSLNLEEWVRSHAENCIFHVTHTLSITCMQILAPGNLTWC